MFGYLQYETILQWNQFHLKLQNKCEFRSKLHTVGYTFQSEASTLSRRHIKAKRECSNFAQSDCSAPGRVRFETKQRKTF